MPNLPTIAAGRDTREAHRIGLRFGTDLRAAHTRVDGRLAAAQALLAGADPDVRPVGAAFLAGIRSALTVVPS